MVQVVYESREALFRHIPLYGHVAVVGPADPAFVRFLLENCPAILTLYLVVPTGALRGLSTNGDGSFEVGRWECADPRVQWVEGTPSAFWASMRDGALHGVYLEGGCGYEEAAESLLQARRVVRPGGLIAGNDFATNPAKCPRSLYFGVRRALDEMCDRERSRIRALGLDGRISYLIDNHM